MRDLQNNNSDKKKIGRKYFNFRVLDEEISTEMTGFPRNGVTPFLLGEEIKVVIASDNINKGVGSGPWTRAFWLGGGNVDVKLSNFLSLSNF